MMTMRLSRGQTAPTDAMIREHYAGSFDANEQVLRAILDVIDKARSVAALLADADRIECLLADIAISSRGATSTLEFVYDVIVQDRTDDATSAQRHGSFRVLPLEATQTVRKLRPLLRRVSEVVSLIENVHELDRRIRAMQRSADRSFCKLRDIESTTSRLRADDPRLPTLRERATQVTERRRAKIDAVQRAMATRQRLLRGEEHVIAEEDAIEKRVQDVANCICSRCGHYTAFSESLALRHRRREIAQRTMRGMVAVMVTAVCVMGLSAISSLLRDASNASKPKERHSTVYLTTIAHMATALARQWTDSPAKQAFTDAQAIVAGELVSARRRQNEKAVFGVSNALVEKWRMDDAQACAEVAVRIDLNHAVATNSLRGYALRLACERGLQAACVAYEKQLKNGTYEPYIQYFMRVTNEKPQVEDMETLTRAHMAYSLVSCDLGWGISCFEIGSYAVATVSHLDLPGMYDLGRTYLRRGCDVEHSQSCDLLEELDG